MADYVLTAFNAVTSVVTSGARQIKIRPSSLYGITESVKKNSVKPVSSYNGNLFVPTALISNASKVGSRPIKLPSGMAVNVISHAKEILKSPQEVTAMPVAETIIAAESKGADAQTSEVANLEEASDLVPIISEPVVEAGDVADSLDSSSIEEVPVITSPDALEGDAETPELSVEGIESDSSAKDDSEVMFEVKPKDDLYDSIARMIDTQKEAVNAEENSTADLIEKVDEAIDKARPFVPRGGTAARISQYEPESIGFDERGNLVGVEPEYKTPEVYTEARIVGSSMPEEVAPSDSSTIIEIDDSLASNSSFEQLKKLREKAKELREKNSQIESRIQSASDKCQEAEERMNAAKKELDAVIASAIAQESSRISELEESISASAQKAESIELSVRDALEQESIYRKQAEEIKNGIM